MSVETPLATASTVSSISNLCKTIIGAGMLAIPFAFRADGIILGIMIIILAGVTSSFGLYLQFLSTKFVPEIERNHITFFKICSITYPKLAVIFDFAIFLQCFGCCISYLIIIGDLLPELIAVESFQRLQAILSSVVVIVPLIFLKKLDSLKYSSILGLMAIGYLFVLVVCHYIAGDVTEELKGPVSLIKPLNLSSILSTFSIIIFAFTGHQNMFSIINESKDKSKKNISIVISVSMLISTILFIIIGLIGYLTFGSKVNGNIILLYDNTKIVNILGRYLTIFMVMVSFPLMFHPCRLSANNIFYFFKTKYFISKEEENESISLLDNSKPKTIPFSDTTFIYLTSILGFLAYVLSISIKEFALILSLVGATGSTTISFILPGLFGFKLLKDKLQKMSLLLIIWGFTVMILCVSATILLN